MLTARRKREWEKKVNWISLCLKDDFSRLSFLACLNIESRGTNVYRSHTWRQSVVIIDDFNHNRSPWGFLYNFIEFCSLSLIFFHLNCYRLLLFMRKYLSFLVHYVNKFFIFFRFTFINQYIVTNHNFSSSLSAFFPFFLFIVINSNKLREKFHFLLLKALLSWKSCCFFHLPHPEFFSPLSLISTLCLFANLKQKLFYLLHLSARFFFYASEFYVSHNNISGNIFLQEFSRELRLMADIFLRFAQNNYEIRLRLSCDSQWK